MPRAAKPKAPEVIEGQYVATGSTIAVRDDAPLAEATLFSGMRPAQRVLLATEIADALNDVIVKRNLYTDIQGKRHVRAEGWQTCAMLCGVTAKITSVDRVHDPEGYQAHAIVVRVDSGVEIGGGDGLCTRLEGRWKKADDYAVSAMAQTRAISRALRGNLAWIVALAGYAPTPAEEMDFSRPAQREQDPNDLLDSYEPPPPPDPEALRKKRDQREMHRLVREVYLFLEVDPNAKDVAVHYDAILTVAQSLGRMPIPTRWSEFTPADIEAFLQAQSRLAAQTIVDRWTMSDDQRKLLFALEGELNIKTERERYDGYSRIAKREITSSAHLTETEYGNVIKTYNTLLDALNAAQRLA